MVYMDLMWFGVLFRSTVGASTRVDCTSYAEGDGNFWYVTSLTGLISELGRLGLIWSLCCVKDKTGCMEMVEEDLVRPNVVLTKSCR